MYTNILTKYITEYNDNNYSIIDISEKLYLTYDFIVPKKNLKNVNVKIVDLKCKLLSLHWLNYLYYNLTGYENIFTDEYIKLEGDNFYKQEIVMILLKQLIIDAAEKVELEQVINIKKANSTFNNIKSYAPFSQSFETDLSTLKRVISIINSRVLFNEENRENYIKLAKRELIKQPKGLNAISEWIYVISPGEYHYGDIYKIGMTTRSPEKRLSELNNTSTYNNFFPHTFLPTDDAALYEKNMHHKLGNYRINSRREFFKLDVLNLINSLLDDFDLFNFYFFI